MIDEYTQLVGTRSPAPFDMNQFEPQGVQDMPNHVLENRKGPPVPIARVGSGILSTVVAVLAVVAVVADFGDHSGAKKKRVPGGARRVAER